MAEQEVDPALMTALESLAAAPVLLAAFDFDGTLAPFVVDPADARALPESQAALDRLAGLERTWVGIISGRDLRFLTEVVDREQTKLLSGSHGAELDLRALGSQGGSGIRLSPDQQRLLAQAAAAAEEVAARFPGAVIEHKPAGVCLHTRPLRDPSLSDAALAQMRERFDALQGLRVTPGQQVMECSVLSATKGEGVRALIDAVGADAALFVGDDVTDEDGMRALRPQDVGIKVGDKETCAPHRVASPEALARVLTRFAQLRADAVA